MDIFETIKDRYSVRKYQDKSIPEKDLNQILEAGRLAPSAYNSQNYRIIAVKDKVAKEQLADITKMPFVSQAPVVLVGVAPDPSNEYWQVDMAIVFDHISLTAVELGLGTCWVGTVKDEAKIRQIVNAPNDSEARIVMPLGYPDHKAMPKSRKKFSQIYSDEKYE